MKKISKSTRKFLRKGADIFSHHVGCQWIHVVDYNDERVMVTADGFRMHIDWDIDDDDPTIQIDGCQVLAPSVHTRHWNKTAIQLHNKIPDSIEKFVDYDNTYELRFDQHQLIKAVGNFPDDTMIMVIVPNGGVYLVSSKFMYCLKPLSVDRDRILDKPVCLPVAKIYVKQILKYVDPVIALDATSLSDDAVVSKPATFGEWGQRVALIMPMSNIAIHEKMVEAVARVDAVLNPIEVPEGNEVKHENN